jgi:hypothetical protein
MLKRLTSLPRWMPWVILTVSLRLFGRGFADRTVSVICRVADFLLQLPQGLIVDPRQLETRSLNWKDLCRSLAHHNLVRFQQTVVILEVAALFKLILLVAWKLLGSKSEATFADQLRAMLLVAIIYSSVHGVLTARFLRVLQANRLLKLKRFDLLWSLLWLNYDQFRFVLTLWAHLITLWVGGACLWLMD